jgi:hypothetical protein
MAATNAGIAPFTGKGENVDARAIRNIAAAAGGAYFAAPYLGYGAATATAAPATVATPEMYAGLGAETAGAGGTGMAEMGSEMGYTMPGVAPGTAGTPAAAGVPAGAGSGAGSGAATSAGMSTSQKIALGLGGLGALSGAFSPKPPVNNLVNPTIQNAGNQLIDQAMKGQLNPGDMGRIATSRTQDLARSADYYAKAGLSDSSMATAAAADINAKYDNAAYQITQGYYQQGMQAAGITNSQVAQQVQLAMQQDQAAQAAQSQFFQTLMMYSMS